MKGCKIFENYPLNVQVTNLKLLLQYVHCHHQKDDMFNEYFAHIDDPRQAHKIKHLLSEVLFITVLAIIAGADDFHEIARYAKMKYHWLTSFLKLSGGVPSHDTFNSAVRKHWFIENKLHWIPDVIFREDYCRVRTGNGAGNLNTIRKIALNTIKRDNTVQTSFKNKRKMCGWNDNFALNILKNMKA